TIWLQPGGDTRGQSWSGFFRDVDGNGIMEFAAPEVPLPKGRWTRELNFLAWQPINGKQELELPAKATVRVSLLWREAHDPQFLRRGEDLYQQPLAKLTAVLLRQREPGGEKIPADEMEVVARSYGLPQRIDNQPDAATYEQTVEFTVPEAGRYALRIEGRAPKGIRPENVPTVPAIHTDAELRVRALVEVIDTPSRAACRAVFLDFPNNEGAIGM